MTADERAERIRTCVHELAHALVARRLGYSVRTINITHSGGNSGGCVRLGKGPEVSRPLMTAIDDAVHLMAGDIAGDLLTPIALATYPERLPGEDQPPEVVAAAIAALPSDDAAEAVDRFTDETVIENDETKARYWSELGGQAEAWELLAFCRARARRYVCEHAAMIVGLIPALFARPIMDGFALEAAIQALEAGVADA